MGATRSHNRGRGSRGGGGSRGRGAYYRALYGGRKGRSSDEPHRYDEEEIGNGSGSQRAVGSREDLAQLLSQLDGQQYGAYKQLGRRTFQLDGFQVTFDHIQADAYAGPSRIRVRVLQETALFPAALYTNRIRTIASAHFLTRQVHAHTVSKQEQEQRGGGWKAARGGDLSIDGPGQEVVERSSIVINDAFVEARMTAGLPAAGRTILGRVAHRMLLETLPRIVSQTLVFSAIDGVEMHAFADSIEDQDALRAMLAPAGLVAFIGNGSVLPRRSGVSDLPLDTPGVVRFQAPADITVSFELPNRGHVEGMGVRRGITVIGGGGFHGKSTLLRAFERGVYNHVPGDGRELVVADATATKVRAEDGRFVGSVDIRPFIQSLPFGADTRDFSTADASGSTSMAASIQEALEAGATALLLDEDTCATNFLIRDQRMQCLVPRDREPITPLISRVRELWQAKQVSVVLVVGGCGDYLDVATTVLCMDAYRVRDATAEAAAVVARIPVTVETAGSPYGTVPDRFVSVPRFAKPPRARTRGAVALFPPNNPATAAPSLASPGAHSGSPDNSHASEAEPVTELDLSALDQLVSVSQTRCIARAIDIIAHTTKTPAKLSDMLASIDAMALDRISGQAAPVGDLARPRRIELAFALNRLRLAKLRL